MKKLELFGVVGDYWDECITAKKVSEFLSSLEKDEKFEVLINSPGGEVFEGLSIYNLLAEHSQNCTVKIIGEASSIASVISCAASKVMIAESAVMLIHKPWTIAWGNEDDMEKVQKNLKTLKNSIIKVYTRKTGRDEDYIDSLMKDEDYHSAEACVEIGLADEVYVPSESETQTAQALSKNMRLKLLKYAAMNHRQNSQTKGDTYMPYKSLEEAVEHIGRLTAEKTGAEQALSEMKGKYAALEDQHKTRNSDYEALDKAHKDILAKHDAAEKALAALREDSFVAEAKLFCAQMMSEGRMNRSEYVGTAKADEMPAKVRKLVAFRKQSQELYDLECEEIRNRSTAMMDYLKSPLPADTNDEGYLVNYAKQKHGVK